MASAALPSFVQRGYTNQSLVATYLYYVRSKKCDRRITKKKKVARFMAKMLSSNNAFLQKVVWATWKRHYEALMYEKYLGGQLQGYATSLTDLQAQMEDLEKNDPTKISCVLTFCVILPGLTVFLWTCLLIFLLTSICCLFTSLLLSLSLSLSFSLSSTLTQATLCTRCLRLQECSADAFKVW